VGTEVVLVEVLGSDSEKAKMQEIPFVGTGGSVKEKLEDTSLVSIIQDVNRDLEVVEMGCNVTGNEGNGLG
jgi:hypothetical protein